MNNISIACAVMDRSEILNVSLSSWLRSKNVTEIKIIDWNSKKSIKHLEKLDERISIETVKNKKYFNISKAFNLAIKKCKGEVIMKMDADYILNPYYSLIQDLDLQENEFYCGDWKFERLDNKCGFLTYTNGFLLTHKKNIEKCGGYNENLEGYGFDDNEIQRRLIKIGVKRKIIPLEEKIYIYHNPHGDSDRVINYKNKTTTENRNSNEEKSKNERCAKNFFK